MRKKSFKNKSVKSISAIVGASALVMGMGFSQPVQASDPFIAEIIMFGGNFAPRGWAFCDGQLLQISQYSAVFSLMGTTFGGDGRSTFGLPDLRGRVAVHPGTGPGLSQVRWGEKAGVQTNYLTVSQMPAHTHTATVHASDGRGNDSNPDGNVMAEKSRTNIYSNAAPNVTMRAGAVTVASAGGGQGIENRMPFLGVYHIIALQGTFPSRN